ncbi:MAG: ferrous iron transporter B [Erysipelotrichaceae bacterium]|nr:ferrous iron transporter B [Erysipelotrichaceae bacterium]
MNRIALLGQPNSGKSTVFNALTLSRQHVGNWPGKTVEKKDGSYIWKNVEYTLTDLPGSYSLSGNSDEEIITENYIKNGEADLVCVLVDASQLERSMYMLAEFAALDTPAVLLLNMMDVADLQGKKIDADKLNKNLGIPVLPFTAAEDKDYDKLKDLFVKELADPHKLSSVPEKADDKNVKEAVNAKYVWIEKMLNGVTENNDRHYVLHKWDKILLSPVKGKIVCIAIVFLGFLMAMMICIPFMGIGSMLPGLLNKPIADFLNSFNVHPWLVSIFSLLIPNTLYFALSMAAFVFGVNIVFGFLEEVGFLARTAYQFDNVLSKLGLQGKAVAPMLMGLGCTIGGASGTRVMDNWGQKMLAMAIVWAVPCGSIWSVAPVVSSMFFPAWGTILVCIGIMAYVFFMMRVVSKVFGNTLAPIESRTGMIMELPPYHKAHWKHIIKEAFYKAFDIFKRALRTVLLISLIFWVFSYTSTGNVEDSLLYKVGTVIEPVTRIFGLGWRTFVAFLSSAFAKEAVLGVLNALFVGQGNVMDITFNANKAAVDTSLLAASMTSVVSKPEALAFIFACTFNIPCVMALFTTYRESHSFKWTARVALFYIGTALLLSFVVYHVSSLVLH